MPKLRNLRLLIRVCGMVNPGWEEMPVRHTNILNMRSNYLVNMTFIGMG